MVNMTIQANMRQPDSYGSGHFGASRGSRTHHGIDFACWAGSTVCSTVKGEVTNLGYTYKDDLSFRYVQVTDDNTGHMHRFFYVQPGVEKGDKVEIGQALGTVQDLLVRYPNGMTNHFHYEIMYLEDNKRKYLDPESFLG